MSYFSGLVKNRIIRVGLLVCSNTLVSFTHAQPLTVSPEKQLYQHSLSLPAVSVTLAKFNQKALSQLSEVTYPNTNCQSNRLTLTPLSHPARREFFISRPTLKPPQTTQQKAPVQVVAQHPTPVNSSRHLAANRRRLIHHITQLALNQPLSSAPPELLSLSKQSAPQPQVQSSQPIQQPSIKAGIANTPTTGWIVQIGSFDTLHRAKKLIQQVAQRGYSATTYFIQVKGRGKHRVYLGPFQAKSAAQHWRDEINRAFSLKSYLHHWRIPHETHH